MTALVLTLASALVASGCIRSSEEVRVKQVTELKSELSKLPHDVRVKTPPERKGFPEGPGVIYGTFTSPEGENGYFWVSMGPSAEVLPGRGLGSYSPTATDAVFMKVAADRKLTQRELERFYGTIGDLEGVVCKVTTYKPCPI